MPYYLSRELCNQLLEDAQFDRLISKDSRHNIRTASDLIGTDYCKLRLLAHQKRIDFELQKMFKDRLLKQNFSLIHCKKNLSRELTNTLKSGSPTFNEILGKIFSKSIVEIFGQAGSGKSQLVFSLALESSLIEKQVLFIDCDLSFSKDRLLQIANHKYSHYPQSEIQRLLSFIRLYPIFHLEKLIDFLQNIARNKHFHNSLVIIDSLTSILLTNSYIGDTKDCSELYRKRLVTICQCCQVLKWTANQANLHIVLTRLSTNELKFNWNVLLAADLSVSLENEPNNSNINVNVFNRTCNQLSSSINEFTIEINSHGVM